MKIPFMFSKQTGGGTRVFRLEWQAYDDANFTVDITNMKFYEISRSTSSNYIDYMKQIYGEANVGSRLENGNIILYTDNVPNYGTWKSGDVVINILPTELGSAGSKYIIEKWKCIVDGSPGTWIQCRVYTVN